MFRSVTLTVCLIILSHGLKSQVFINEILTSPPDGPGSTVNANSLYNTDPAELPAYNKEWIELYNADPCNPADISCFTLAGNMQPPSSGSGPNWGAFTFPAGTVIPPLGFLIIGGNYSQVPVLNFNLGYYRQNFFGSQYLCGETTRWFLRDEFGWIALYNQAGQVVDAIYWNVYSDPALLYSEEEYIHPVVTTTSCISGSQLLSSASSISGIEFVGAPVPGSNLSFQRQTDGSSIWFPGPVSPTPGNCNGICVGPPTVQVVTSDESCAGNDGSISVTVIDGGTGPYTINWGNPSGSHSPVLGGLSSGVYYYEIVDAYNCFRLYDTVVIASGSSPQAQIVNITNASCNLNNGSASLSVSGGNPPYAYAWSTSPAQTTSVLSNATSGHYLVTVTDALGCTDTTSVTLLHFPPPVLYVDSLKDEMCSASNGALYTHAEGGLAPYTFTFNGINQPEDYLSAHAGFYTIIVSDLNGCTDTAYATLTDTPPPVISFPSVSHETCSKVDGMLTALISGGNPPYHYYWEEFPWHSALHLDSLHAGLYHLTVSDVFCTITAGVEILNIPGPKADFAIHPQVQSIEDAWFRFEDLSSGGVHSWFWDFGDSCFSQLTNPFHTYYDTGSFAVKLVVSDYQGCLDSITRFAVVIEPPCIFAPNCFSPDGNGVNDVFFIFGNNISDPEIIIYNRWGEKVFVSNSLQQGWDGSCRGGEVPDGLYVWQVFYSEDWRVRKQRKMLTGTVMLLR